MKKRIIAMLMAGVMCLTALVGCGGNTQGGENNTQTVMTVDGEDVPANELAAYIVYNIYYYEQMYSQYGMQVDASMFADEDSFNSLKESATEQIKSLRALQKMAKEKGVSLTSDQKKELKETKKSNMEYTGAYSDTFKRWVAYTVKGKEDPWTTYLNKMGYTEELFDKDCEILKLEDGIIDQYYDEGKITKKFKKNYLHAKSILISDSDEDGNVLTGADKKKAKKKAEKVLAKLQNGEDFDTLWKKYNDDSAQKKTGYYFTEGSMVSPYEKAVKNLKENETTDKLVYYKGYGWFIIERLPLEEDALTDPDCYMGNSSSSSSSDTTLKTVIGQEMVNDELQDYIDKLDVKTTDEYDKITIKNVNTYLGFVTDPLVATEGSGSVADGSAGGSAQ